ncbi:hypothetical protein C8J57DRAFT_1494616 [Mycena rebaudengoi]|nr:hypothetical protein C8J57DRAFT_1494616 [Mycena rebaudengoi]
MFKHSLTISARPHFPVASTIALKAGITTLSLAYLLMVVRSNDTAYMQALAVLHSLRWINKPSVPGLLSLPSSGMEILRIASFLLAPAQPQQLGQLNTQRSHLFQQLRAVMSSTMPPTDAPISTEIVSPQTHAPDHFGCNLAAQEVTLDRFLSTARSQAQADLVGLVPPNHQWGEAIWLWGMVEGTESLDSTRLNPPDLQIALYNMYADDDDGNSLYF